MPTLDDYSVGRLSDEHMSITCDTWRADRISIRINALLGVTDPGTRATLEPTSANIKADLLGYVSRLDADEQAAYTTFINANY